MATTVTPSESMDPRAYLSHPDALYEIVDGRVVEKPEMGILAALVANRLGEMLREFCKLHNAGAAVVEAIFILDAIRDLRRRPDVAFVSVDRWPAGRAIPDEGDWKVVPDLCIEILSPTDLDKNVMSKMRQYFQLGVRRVWLVRPLEAHIYVYRSPTDVTIFGEGGTLVDEELLPGFRLEVSPLFRRTPT